MIVRRGPRLERIARSGSALPKLRKETDDERRLNDLTDLGSRRKRRGWEADFNGSGQGPDVGILRKSRPSRWAH
eukprot:7383917-Prymnesium_polylepis.1